MLALRRRCRSRGVSHPAIVAARTIAPNLRLVCTACIGAAAKHQSSWNRYIKESYKRLMVKRHPPFQLEDIFISTNPATISTAAVMRMADSASPSTSTPTMNEPTAPMPVQMV